MRILGLDPGTHTGWAMWDTEKFAFDDVVSMPIHVAMRLLQVGAEQQPNLIVMEDARLRKWFGKADADEAKYGAARREGAGAAKRDAAIWDDFLSDLEIPFLKRKPVGTKRSAEEFRRLSQWDKPTNEHSRDAGLLVLQINTPMAKQMLREAGLLRTLATSKRKGPKRATA